MPDAPVSAPEPLSVTRDIRIAAPVEKVWIAVTDPAHISRWFGATELSGRGAGAEGAMSFPDGRRLPMRVEESEPPRRVVYRWNNDDAAGVDPAAFDPSTATTFVFTLEPDGDGTVLTVVETGFEATSDAAQNLRFHERGWVDVLDDLAAHLEGRR